MSQSKYINLPDIDTQPDVYESPDTPEENDTVDGGNYLDLEEPNENIVKEKISVGEAVDKFKDNFSDSITRRKKNMYKVYVKRPVLDTNEYEYISKEPTLRETPVQKLRRLIFEAQELDEELEKDKNDESKPKKPLHSAMVEQLSSLQKDLSRLSQNIGEPDSIDEKEGTIIKQAELSKKLINQLQSFKHSGVPKENGISKDKDTPTATETNVHTLAKTVELDDRIAALEKLVGTAHGQNFEDLSISITNTNLIAAIDKLDQHMQLLAQPRHLESISRKAKTLVGELEKVNELKNKELSNGGVIPFETEEKINYLFTLLDKVDPLMSIAPALVNRLKSLQQLHQEASVFSETIKMLTSEQNKISEELKSLDGVAEKLEKSFEINDTAIQQNIDVVDSRVTDLAGRLDKLLANFK
ncbi:14965_t:CDS:2 [Entrophospora sp. SA101]|nr:23952_t:CDS:2 [Entrophospora sp. SA101]CAJ0759116.1 14965_t:CDS:2 [Entrophospora sp. SA101]